MSARGMLVGVLLAIFGGVLLVASLAARDIAGVVVATWQPMYSNVVVFGGFVIALIAALALFAGVLSGFDAISDLAAQVTGVVALVKMGHAPPHIVEANAKTGAADEAKRWAEITRIQAQADRTRQQIEMDTAPPRIAGLLPAGSTTPATPSGAPAAPATWQV